MSSHDGNTKQVEEGEQTECGNKEKEKDVATPSPGPEIRRLWKVRRPLKGYRKAESSGERWRKYSENRWKIENILLIMGLNFQKAQWDASGGEAG